MCENHHSHHHFNKKVLFRLILAVVLFIAAFVLKNELKIVLFIFAYLLAGGDVIFKALSNIFKGRIFDENFLMSIASLGAVLIEQYPEAAAVMILYQIGEILQHYAVEKSKKSISNLMNIRPDYANIEINGKLKKIDPSDVNVGDIITVQTGEKIPLDGTVVEGFASIDTSALTGEAMPEYVKVGDRAISGCINTSGMLKIRVEKEFSQSTVAKILELVEHAQQRKTKTENFITKFAKFYTPIVVLGAFLLAFIPPVIINGDFNVWFERALTFLVISCPCALVISVPLTFFAGIGGASKNGILVKGTSYIEHLSKVYAVVFDKTGTLTKGKFEVSKICAQEGFTESEILMYSACAEKYSNHPIAVSLKSACENADTEVTELKEFSGNGVKANVNGIEVLAGNTGLLKMFNIEHDKIEGTVVYVAIGGKFAGYIIVSDELKDDAKTAILSLKKYKTVMLTGDNQSSAELIANKLGISQVYSKLSPVQKVEKVEELMNENNGTVIFVGDGINDTPVLTRCDVGIAMGNLDAAIEACDVVIMDDKPSKVAKAIAISRKTMRIVKENIVFAIFVKFVFLCLGSFGLITMWGAVFADVGVTLLAVMNSLRAYKA